MPGKKTESALERTSMALALGNHDDQDGLGTWFPLALYAFPENGPAMRECWSKVFDKYHVDMVFHGHVHCHLRTKPNA